MLAQKTNEVSSPQPHGSFFRQSGWLMIANICGGVLMWAVHLLAKKTGPQEYGVFGAFLAVAMVIPTMPLQMVMAQQTARALATNRERELAGMIRLVCVGTFVVWLVAAILVLLFQDGILQRWNLASPVTLWLILPVLLLSLWLPIFWGVLQGQQNFLPFGWSMMVNGAGRLAVAGVAVWLGAKAAGMLVGVVIGLIVAVAIAVWHSRSAWAIASTSFDWRSLLKQVIPLMFGFGAFQFLMTADTMFTKAYFDSETVGFYVSAGTLSRALMWLVGPLTAVMFPRIVHSVARAEKTNLVGMVLLGTAVLAIGGALGLSLLAPWLVKYIYTPSFVQVAATLLPWYAFAMVPLAVGNVLLNSLLARSSFRVVPAVLVVALGYAFALTRFHDTPVMVLKTLGVANLFFLIVCAWFTWICKEKANS